MSASITSIDTLGDDTYRLNLASTESDPVYSLYRNGVLIATTESDYFDVVVAPGDSPTFVVIDQTESAPTGEADYPPRLTIRWSGVDGAYLYRIEELIDAAWVTRAQILDEGLGQNFRGDWETRVLEDGEEHSFRVLAVTSANLESTALQRTALMVRHPDAPNPTYTYASGTGLVTVSD